MCDSHTKRWAWVPPLPGKSARQVAVQLERGEVHICEVSRHSSGGFVLTSERAIFTSCDIATAPQAPRSFGRVGAAGPQRGAKRALAPTHDSDGAAGVRAKRQQGVQLP